YMAQHAWCFPIEPAVRLNVDCFEWRAEHAPLWNTISISGYHIREAGATAAQELAFTLADGFTYVERGMARGLDVDDFAPRLSFFWDIHNDFFEEIAKLRAARRIWARHLKERYGAKNPRSWMMRFHSQTAGVTLTAQLEREAEELFTRIDEMGGVVKGLEEGWFQKRIAESAARQQWEIEQRRRLVVGVNEFVTDEPELSIPILRIGHEADLEQR